MPKLSGKRILVHSMKGTKVFDLLMAVYDYLWMVSHRNSFSDHGEDIFVFEYFNRKNDGVYIDVGANHPFRISNTYLLYRKGWKGITVEPLTRLYELHRKARPRDVHLNCGVSASPGSMTLYELTPGVMSTFEKAVADDRVSSGSALLVKEHRIDVITLQEIVDKHLAGVKVDLLTVDTEGHDLEVLKGVDWSSFRPRLIICESFEDARQELDAIMKANGYREIKRLGYNTVYESTLNVGTPGNVV